MNGCISWLQQGFYDHGLQTSPVVGNRIRERITVDAALFISIRTSAPTLTTVAFPSRFRRFHKLRHGISRT